MRHPEQSISGLLSYRFGVFVSLRNRELLEEWSCGQSQPSETAVNVERGGQLFFISCMCIWNTTAAGERGEKTSGKREAIRTMPTPSPHSFLVPPVSQPLDPLSKMPVLGSNTEGSAPEEIALTIYLLHQLSHEYPEMTKACPSTVTPILIPQRHGYIAGLALDSMSMFRPELDVSAF
jgi:hypothetical protein